MAQINYLRTGCVCVCVRVWWWRRTEIAKAFSTAALVHCCLELSLTRVQKARNICIF